MTDRRLLTTVVFDRSPRKKPQSEAKRWSTYNPSPTPDTVQDPVPYSDDLIASIQERLETEEKIRRRRQDADHRNHIAAQIKEWDAKISRSLLDEGKATFIDTRVGVVRDMFRDEEIFGPVAQTFLDRGWAVKWTSGAFLVAPPSKAKKENNDNDLIGCLARRKHTRREILGWCSCAVLMVATSFGATNLIGLTTGSFAPWMSNKPLLILTACVWMCAVGWLLRYAVSTSRLLDDLPDPTPWELPTDDDQSTDQENPAKKTRTTHV